MTNNDQKTENLRANITSSVLLTDHEKGDWLNLLELMNDKQVGELEEILKSSVTAPAKQKGPELSHISNLPTQMAYVKPEPKIPPVTSMSQTLPVTPPQAPGARVIAPPVLPKVSDQPLAQAVVNAPSKIHLQTQNASVNLSPPLKSTIAKPIPTASESAISIRPDPKSVLPVKPAQVIQKQVAATLNDLSDVVRLDITSFRKFDHQAIIDSFKNLVKGYGYFTVLQNFESSKLYKSYITKGKNLLAGESTEGLYTVSQEEFELIADILQFMRLNR